MRAILRTKRSLESNFCNVRFPQRPQRANFESDDVSNEKSNGTFRPLDGLLERPTGTTCGWLCLQNKTYYQNVAEYASISKWKYLGSKAKELKGAQIAWSGRAFDWYHMRLIWLAKRNVESKGCKSMLPTWATDSWFRNCKPFHWKHNIYSVAEFCKSVRPAAATKVSVRKWLHFQMKSNLFGMCSKLEHLWSVQLVRHATNFGCKILHRSKVLQKYGSRCSHKGFMSKTNTFPCEKPCIFDMLKALEWLWRVQLVRCATNFACKTMLRSQVPQKYASRCKHRSLNLRMLIFPKENHAFRLCFGLWRFVACPIYAKCSQYCLQNLIQKQNSVKVCGPATAIETYLWECLYFPWKTMHVAIVLGRDGLWLNIACNGFVCKTRLRIKVL